MPDIRRELVELLPRLRRFAFVLARSHADAEDLVQTAVERALRHASSWQAGTRLDSWLYKIVQNLWRDELRAHRRRAESLDEATDVAGVDGRETTLNHLRSIETRAALAELPEEQRLVVALVVLEGMSYQEAADVLNVPTGTVMSRLARARVKLATRLDDPAERMRMNK